MDVNCEVSDGVPVVSDFGLFRSSAQLLLNENDEAMFDMFAPSVELDEGA